MISGGFILKARKSLESELMDKPPLYSKLWDWMLLRAEWRDGAKLKRGQFRTSIEEMQEAMSWLVGYRRVTPSIKEIRCAYEWFAGRSHESPHEGDTKGTMIGITRGTRGMLITITNYEVYQTIENYEGHNEGHNERSTKGRQRAPEREEVKEAKKEERQIPEDRNLFVEGAPPLRLATYLYNCIRRNRPEFKQPDLQAWARHVDLMLRIDKRDPEHIREVIKWAQADNIPQEGSKFCWAANILSTAKLRAQFDQLAMKMAAAQAPPGVPRRPRATTVYQQKQQEGEQKAKILQKLRQERERNGQGNNSRSVDESGLGIPIKALG
ncbi:hypothetical protein SAMN04488503_2226 [Humidesulfovibrio mexicanus]|uniref:Uncharacterized protein n=1 Tax=Humidesulfovibrio mexicanus TaxID=147047 RepID=A0A239AV29_9BACT|nr:hypothetical protein [Humidesulfovibrio mexicanus]SNR99191.1 hypothetical protein SAMN04488503_2226 [Humidesulfovibrio mexicanus]